MATQSTQTLLDSITTHVKAKMSTNDPSHNFAHVQRVLNLSITLLARERILNPNTTYDETAIKLSALLHDLNDKKYTSSPDEEKETIPTLLIHNGASQSLAEKVQKITSHISYSTEKQNPQKIYHLIHQEGLIELSIVQDADRLDALGAVGIARCFTFHGARGGEERFLGEEGEWELGNAIGHFREKLERLAGGMKTSSGREMVKVRGERIRVFREWWEEEVADATVDSKV